jgi:hypothetical protein
VHGNGYHLRHWLSLLVRNAACLAIVSLNCCAQRPQRQPQCDAAPNPSAEAEILTLAARFERDATFRRTCLSGSLVNPDNSYTKLRLAHYRDEDWGKLPEIAFKTRPVLPSDLGHPIPTPDETWQSIPSGAFTDSLEDLRRRGEQMFTRFPAQVERSMIPVLRDVNGPARYGLWQKSDSVGGVIWVALPGGVFPSLTCSSCHASIDARGQLRQGVQNHRIDLGRAQDDYTNARTLYSTWGPGRVDIAADGKDNPVVIADVRRVRFESYLHRTANVRNSLTALALRIETGLITAHRSAVRPNRKDAFALAYYLWTLGDDFDLSAPMHHPGRANFERHCATCHRGPEHAGPPVTPESVESPVGSMPSSARGTGTLQTSSLLGVSARKRLLYGGEAHGLVEFLDPSRTSGGHYVGRNLTNAERQSILAYLESL